LPEPRRRTRRARWQGTSRADGRIAGEETRSEAVSWCGRETVRGRGLETQGVRRRPLPSAPGERLRGCPRPSSRFQGRSWAVETAVAAEARAAAATRVAAEVAAGMRAASEVSVDSVVDRAEGSMCTVPPETCTGRRSRQTRGTLSRVAQSLCRRCSRDPRLAAEGLGGEGSAGSSIGRQAALPVGAAAPQAYTRVFLLSFARACERPPQPCDVCGRAQGVLFLIWRGNARAPARVRRGTASRTRFPFFLSVNPPQGARHTRTHARTHAGTHTHTHKKSL